MALDDPSNFLTRITIFSELQQMKNDEFLNITTVRSIVAIGKRFTTRLDVPIVYNSTPLPGSDSYGLGDISVRLLGYRIYGSPKSVLLTSVEFSFNTAQSPLLGTGKNAVIPTVSYSWLFPKKRTILALSFQQFYSLWGDDDRKDFSFTRLQGYHIKAWSKKVWTVVLPELYIDHFSGGMSMNLEAKIAYRITGRLAAGANGGVGLFGDHPARYKWTSEVGLQYLLIRKGKK